MEDGFRIPPITISFPVPFYVGATYPDFLDWLQTAIIWSPMSPSTDISMSLSQSEMLPTGGQYAFPQMLELSTRPWLYALSQRYNRPISKLRDIPVIEFEQLFGRGFRVIWLMGIWALGEYGLNYDRTDPGLLAEYRRVLPDYGEEDIIGSPFAITEYNVNPELGSWSDLVRLKCQLNMMGLKLMLDFVPNHTAVDSPWATLHPNYYVHERKGVPPPYDLKRCTPSGMILGASGWGDSWKDTIQLNYWDLDLKLAQISNLHKIASSTDYIRCDMSHLCLNDVISSNWNDLIHSWGYSRPESEFWTDAIRSVKDTYKNVKFVAEVYDPWPQALMDCGFDFTYDKGLYDRLGNGHLDYIRWYLKGTNIDYLCKTAHFVENHDEPRAAAFFGGHKRAKAAAVISMTVPGMRFFHQGQELGTSNKLDVHLRRSQPESPCDSVCAFYQLFNQILSREVFHMGKWTFMDVLPGPDSWRLMAWEWSLDDERILVVVNYSDTSGGGGIILANAQAPDGSNSIPIKEFISGVVYDRNIDELLSVGLYVILESWSYQIFKY